jgi:hypothetical protein
MPETNLGRLIEAGHPNAAQYPLRFAAVIDDLNSRNAT